MINKSVKHSFTGMQQDLSKTRFPNSQYYEGKNIRIVSTDSQSTLAVTNEKGNERVLIIPDPSIINSTTINYYINGDLFVLNCTTPEIDKTYKLPNGTYRYSGTQRIIGSTTIRNSIILFTTDDNGFDCIWEVDDETYDTTLLYLRDMDFSINNPIQVLNNYENEKIDKVYWVDGKNQLRFINTRHSIANGDLENLIDVPVSTINQVSKYNLSQPQIVNIFSGGNHTAGMIQYAYNLYRLNGSQTRASSLSKLISLDKGLLGGGSINENVSSLPVVRISNIDTNFTHIKVYALKYTSLNQLPSVTVIEDREIPASATIDVFDDGSQIATSSIEEFSFLGSDIIIPKHIQSKNSRLFMANYREINFDVNLDTRAYSFNSVGSSTIYTDVYVDDSGTLQGTPLTISSPTATVPAKFDSINRNYDVYKFQADHVTLGGEGPYLKYELYQNANYNADDKYFKDREVYRIGIQFYNSYGQISLPKWIADFRTPEGNLQQKYNKLFITLKPAFYTWLNTGSNFATEYDKPVGYKILVAERTSADKTILASGLLAPMMYNNTSNVDDQTALSYRQDKGALYPKMPNILFRNCNSGSTTNLTNPLSKAVNFQSMSTFHNSYTSECQRASDGADTSGRFYQFNNMLQMYCPEVLFKQSVNLTEDCKLRVKAVVKNKTNYSWTKEINVGDGGIVAEAKTIDGLSTHYAPTVNPIAGDPNNLQDQAAFIGDPGGESPNKSEKNLFYRMYNDLIDKTSSTSTASLGDMVVVSNLDLETQTGGLPAHVIRDSASHYFQVTLDDTLDSANIVISTFAGGSNAHEIYLATDPNGENIVAKNLTATGSSGLSYAYTSIPGFPKVTKFYIFIKNKTASPIGIDYNARAYLTDSNSTNAQRWVAYTLATAIFDPYVAPVASTNYKQAGITTPYEILGTPLVTDKGQGFTTYNNNPTYRFTNSLISIITDGESSWADDGIYLRRIISANVDGQRCITLVPTTGAANYYDNPTIESIYAGAGVSSGDDYAVYSELIRSDIDIYGNGLYGGNTWEDKHRTNYLEIGDYQSVGNDAVRITSPGDTFVNNFKFLRMSRRDVEITKQGVKEYEEIVEYPTESTIDLKNRDDDSLQGWDSAFSYPDANFHNYNTVYSQQANLLVRRDVNFNFKPIIDYDSSVISTKLKTAGEIIDNWTDISINDKITLDGKFGPINHIISFNDNIYAFQDRAFAYLSINPRVQVQGSDGIAVQLGTGTVLDRYQYVSSESGTLNKWSIVTTPSGIYYYDTFNRALNVFKGQLEGISDLKGMHTYIMNNNSLEDLRINNPLIGTGVNAGYDYLNNEVITTFHQSSDGSHPYTITFNEATNTYTSFYDYKPAIYISKGGWLLSTDPENYRLYRHFTGEYNNFYGVTYPSYITLLSNPESDLDTVFDNLTYKNEIYDTSNVFKDAKTFDYVTLWNEHQTSAKTPIVVGRNNNARVKFREWNVQLPRETGKRTRMRNPWMFIKLELKGDNNERMILYEPIVSYSI